MAIFEEQKRSYITLHREGNKTEVKPTVTSTMEEWDKKEKKNEYYLV